MVVHFVAFFFFLFLCVFIFHLFSVILSFSLSIFHRQLIVVLHPTKQYLTYLIHENVKIEIYRNRLHQLIEEEEEEEKKNTLV